jgi:serine protease Do
MIRIKIVFELLSSPGCPGDSILKRENMSKRNVAILDNQNEQVMAQNASSSSSLYSSKRIKKIWLGLLLSAGIVIAALAANNAHAQRATLPDFSDLVEKEAAAVVNVSTKARPKAMRGGANPEDNEQFLEFFRRFMPPDAVPQPRQDPRNPQTPRRSPREPRAPQSDAPLRALGEGSGFIYSADGYVITNAHVVADAEEVTVTLTDKREFKAKVIGSDSITDVAVLKIDGTNFPKVTIGNSEKVKVGEWVLAIGSPFGFDSTVTAGIVSAKQRENPGQFVPLIQTDAAVNPGNSGGPLYNTKGEVIGVNSQIFTGTGGYLGISFAIPINLAADVANQFIKTGKIARSRVGIAFSATPITEELAEALGLPKKDPGILIENAEEGSPAAIAGVKPRDVLQKVDGKAVKNPQDVQRIIFPKAPGTKVALTVWRNGAIKELTATVREVKDGELLSSRPSPSPRVNPSPEPKSASKPNKLGLLVEAMDEDDKKSLSITDGVIISDVSGPAARAGLRPGDAILMLNTTEIKSVAQFNDLVAKLDDKRNAALLVKREEAPPRYITLRPESK